MSRTNIDLDDAAVERVMTAFQFTTKREAVNYALRRLAVAPATAEEIRALRGSGWHGDREASDWQPWS